MIKESIGTITCVKVFMTIIDTERSEALVELPAGGSGVYNDETKTLEIFEKGEEYTLNGITSFINEDGVWEER